MRRREVQDEQKCHTEVEGHLELRKLKPLQELVHGINQPCKPAGPQQKTSPQMVPFEGASGRPVATAVYKSGLTHSGDASWWETADYSLSKSSICFTLASRASRTRRIKRALTLQSNKVAPHSATLALSASAISQCICGGANCVSTLARSLD